MKKAILTAAFVLIVAGRSFAADYYTLPIGIDYQESPGTIGDADSIQCMPYYLNTDTWIDTVTLEEKFEGVWAPVDSNRTTNLAGWWRLHYRGRKGTDTDIYSEWVFVGDTLHADPTDYQGGAVAGEGAVPIYLYAVDTLNDVRVDGVTISMYKAGSFLGSSTTADDTADFTGLDGVDYTFNAYGGGYVFETGKALTCSTPSNEDSLVGYAFSPTPATNSNEFTTLYDWALSASGDTIRFANVLFSLDGSPGMHTTSQTISDPEWWVIADTNGYYSSPIPGLDSCFNCMGLTISVYRPGEDEPAVKFDLTSLPANGSTTWLRDLLENNESE